MNKPLILVVEDDAPIRNLITTTLKTQDYKYIAAATASEALQQATIHAPDVMLLDLGLPDLDGIEVIRRIRSWSATPIIVISARSEDSDKIEALDSGADDYLTKPCLLSAFFFKVWIASCVFELCPISAVSLDAMIAPPSVIMIVPSVAFW